MSSKILVFVSVLAVTASLTIVQERLSCQQFTQGQTFNDSQILGTWHLLNDKRETINSSGEQCRSEFSLANDEDRKNLSDRIGKYVEDLSWESLTLKMRVVYSNANTNETTDFFLEKLEDDGSYRSLRVLPSTSELNNLTSFNRYPMSLKLMEEQYLGMMDCRDKYVFLLGKQAPQGAELDDRLKMFIATYWPEKH